jgi:hypothetical protein
VSSKIAAQAAATSRSGVVDGAVRLRGRAAAALGAIACFTIFDEVGRLELDTGRLIYIIIVNHSNSPRYAVLLGAIGVAVNTGSQPFRDDFIVKARMLGGASGRRFRGWREYQLR